MTATSKPAATEWERRERKLRQAGKRLWTTGGFGKAGVITYCRDNRLTFAERKAVLAGWAAARAAESTTTR